MIKAAYTGPWRYAVYVLMALAYMVLGYLVPRHETIQLIGLYFFLFIIYLDFIREFNSDTLIREGIVLALLLRLVLLFSVPALSDDFYRFIWDGRLINQHINPFQYTPAELHESGQQIKGLTGELYQRLNSKIYYSVYPPVCQVMFSLTALVSSGNIFLNIVLLKTVMFLFEAGTIYFLIKILRLVNVQPQRVLVYALNPLIIVELVGNIHFEAGMIFFLTVSFYLLLRQKILFSAVIFGLAISTKLLPLIFLPLLFRYFGVKKTIFFSATAGLVTLISFLPFLNADLLKHLTSSVSLYFNEFEYNASFYYLGKWMGGWDDLATKVVLQKLLPFLTIAAIIVLALRYHKENFFIACLIAALIYFLFSTTVHPWYIAVLVLFASITPLRFVLYWSGLIMLTYITYSTPAQLEHFGLVAFEYLVVLGVLVYELRQKMLRS